MTSEFAVNILLDAAVKSVVVLVMAGVMMACMRKRSAAARHLLCFLAVASLPVLPVLSWALPGWRVLPGWLDFRGTKPVMVKQPAKPNLTAETPVGIPPTPNRIEIPAPVTPEIVPQENVPSPAIQSSVVPKPPRAAPKYICGARHISRGWPAFCWRWFQSFSACSAFIVWGENRDVKRRLPGLNCFGTCCCAWDSNAASCC